MTAEDRRRFLNAANDLQAETYVLKEQGDNIAKQVKTGLEYTKKGGGITRGVVNGGLDYNPKTNKVERTYITPQGEKTTNKITAGQDAIKYRNAQFDTTVSGQLRNAHRRLEELQRKVVERNQELNEENRKMFDGTAGIFAGLSKAKALEGTTRSDNTLRALEVAIHQTEEQIKTLEEQRDRDMGNDVGFWRGFSRVVTDPTTWDFGSTSVREAATMLRAADKGKPQTEEEKAAYQEMLKSINDREVTDAKYGSNDSFLYRAGAMAGHMPSFMVDFGVTGGVLGGYKLASKAAGKLAARTLGKNAVKEMAEQGFKNYVKRNGLKGLGQEAANWSIKALGTTADELLVRAPVMSNTIQAGKTASDIIDRKLGDVVVDENGNYDFANDKNWGDAAWQGEANSIIENYSEMFGSHLPEVASLGNLGKLANVIGAKRLSGMLTKANETALGGIMNTTRKMFEKMGVSDYVGEVSEEYYGQLWRTMLNLDDAYQQNANGTRTNLFATKQFHGDIWGGMALSMGLMGAGKAALSGVNYMAMKHEVNKADTLASEILTPDIWEPLRSTIDMATNDNVGDVAETILNDKEFTNAEKSAVLNYMERSMYLRGANLAEIAKSRGGEQNEKKQQANESYIDGYNAKSDEELRNVRNMYELKRKEMEETLSPEELEEIDADPISLLDKHFDDQESAQTIVDYINAKQAYDGMIQRVRDDMDSRVSQSNAMVDSRVNKDSGMVQGVTMKAQDDNGNDRRAYVVKGRVVKTDDGTGIDHEKSDKSIAIRYEDTGVVEIVSPSSILSMEDPLDPEEEKQTAAEAIRQQYAKREADRIDGKVAFNAGDTYTLTDENGQAAQVQVVPNKEGLVDNGDGTVNVSSDGGQTVVPMRKEDIQAMVDTTNKARVYAETDSRKQEAASEEPATSNEYNTGDELELKGADGNLTRAVIQQAPSLLNGQDKYLVQVDSPVEGKAAVDWYTKEELDALRNDKPDNEEPPVGGAGAVVEETAREEQPSEKKYIPNNEIISKSTYDNSSDYVKKRGVTSFWADKEDRFRDILSREAIASAKYLNGETSPRDYLLELGYWDGENSWLNRAPDEEVAQEANENAQALLPYLNAPSLETTDNGNIERENIPQNDNIERENVPSALERIPKDEQGQPIYEQADPEMAWDALVEQSGGDANMAAEVANDMVADRETAVKKLSKAKVKAGSTPAEKIAARMEQKRAVEQANAELAHWKAIANTPNLRSQREMAERTKAEEAAAAAYREQQAKEKAAREEAERVEREALQGVPDMVDDTPQDARARGYRRVNGHKVDRQQPLQGVAGKEVNVKFSDTDIPKGNVMVIEADNLQPSHVGGQRNPLHFIDESQPKERNDEASQLAANKIASAIRPEEITTSVTAYTGAPSVNSRGEVIQGNNRSAALKEMWAGYPEQSSKYKAYLMEHAEELGLDPSSIESMEMPVLVNMMDVNDDEAIRLGQFVAQDTESGGTERIKPKNIVQKMGDDIRNYANHLLSSTDEDMTFSELVDRNGLDVLKWMQRKSYISPTQYKSAFDSKGNLTAEAKNDLKGVMYQSIFQNGNTQLEEMFNALPAKAQKAILAMAYRDYDSPNSERMNSEIQSSIMAYQALSQDPGFADAKNYKEARAAVESWKRQLAFDDVTGESYLPSEKFSNFALLLATMYKGQTQTFMQNTFKSIFDLVQGTQETTLFEEPDNTPRTLVNAINETLNNLREELLINENFTYNGQRRNNVLAGGSTAGQQGRQGSDGSAPSGGRNENSARTDDGNGRTGISDNERRGQGHIADIEGRQYDNSSQEAVSEINLSEEVDENGYHFVLSPNGITTFGEIRENSGLTPAPIKLSEGYQDEKGKGYGLIHIDANHGEQIRKAGFDSVEDFVSYVATNYDEDNIRLGKRRYNGSPTFLIQVTDTHDNTLFIEMSKDGSYWNVNSAGIFRKGYSNKKETVVKTEPQQPNNAVSTGSSLSENEEGGITSSEPNGEPTVSAHKDTDKSAITQTIGEKVAKAEEETDTNPTEAQKEAGNYKKGHVCIGQFDITVENPKGSVRRGIDASGKAWEQTMQNTYGYIRGTEGVDGDHIDVFLTNDIDGWNGRRAYIVDQYNEDGTFDEHKVMLGFNDEAEAQDAYLSNYERGWENKHKLVMSSVNLPDFEKWINSSHRKTKPFAEYKSVKIVDDNRPKAESDMKRQLSEFNVGDVVRDYYNKKLYRIKKHSTNGVSTIAELDENGNEISTTTINSYNNPRYGLPEVPIKQEVTTTTDISYGIEPAQYTTHRGKVLDMFLVKFAEPLTKERQRAARELAKAEKGWYDRDKGGFMMRSEESARKLADTVTGDKEAVSDAQPLSLADTRKLEEPVMRQVDVDGLMQAIQENGEAKLSDHFVPQSEQKEETSARKEETSVQEMESSEQNEGNAYGANNKLVSRDRYEELKARMRRKLGGQLNMGIDPEILAIGTEMAAYHIEAGARKFADYARHMIEDLGDAIRPYLKSFYNGARDLPEVYETGLADEMTPYNEVRTFDVANFDKGHSDALATAEMVVNEQEANSQADEAKDKLINQRNEQRRKEDERNKPQNAKNKKKVVSSQTQIADLFGELFEENKETPKTEENGLQRNDAVRPEGLPADRGGHGERLPGSIETSGKKQEEGSQRPDGSRQAGSTELDRSVRPRLLRNTRNNHSERGANHAPTSVDARIDANIKAIELSQQLIENGETATPEQMDVLRKFSGWGGLGKAFSDISTARRLQELLGAEGLEQAIMSANSAYYTPAYVVDTLWDIAERMGFKGGNILEGSAGIGNILGQMPTRISERSDIHAVEIDGTSGNILSLLYPDAQVYIQGFEQTHIPNGSVDLAITNVPFVTGLRVNDTSGDKDLSKKFHNIHDFCIAKNVRKLREGGIGIFISSNGTLDNSKKLRDWVVNEGNADFVGAFRLNNKTFGGTSVTSDIIVIRKRVNGNVSPHAINVSETSGERTAEYDTGETRKAKGQEMPIVKQLPMDYNRYFIEHPENMAGTMRFAFEEGETFRPTSKGLYPSKDKDQKKMLADFVSSFTDMSQEDATKDRKAEPNNPRNFMQDTSSDGKKLGGLYVKDGQLVIASLGGYYPLAVNANKVKGHSKVECFNAYSAIKEALSAVLDYQTNHEGDEGLKPLLGRLNKAYDDFVKTYGHFNKNTAIAFLRNDVDYPNVFSLETYEEVETTPGKRVAKFGKTDIFKKRVVEKEKEPTPTNVKDGIIASIFKYGKIDVPYIAGQLGKTAEYVRKEIIGKGYGFENPATRLLEVSFQYLSGNVREKLRLAQEYNENGMYDNNIKALQDVTPMDIPAHLIDFTLGSSWIDPKLYDDYVQERTGIDVHFISAGGTWYMKAPEYGLNKEKNRAMGVVSEMLHKTIMGHTLIEAAIQNRTITVSLTNKKWDGTTETITDKEATQACAAKIDEIRQDFKDWARQKMQSDAEMSATMERIYNDTFNNFVPMSIPDDFVPEYFGGASREYQMRPHQGKAIVRGTMQPLLLAHEVGTGKTFTLISIAMEMRRLGIATKPMIVVQNATVGQFVASAKELYPNAKILTLEEADRSAEGRKNFYAKIKYNDWDMVIVPQSTFEFIPDSEERQMSFIQDKIEEKKIVLEQMREADPTGRSVITKQAEREIEQLQTQLAELTDEASKKHNGRIAEGFVVDKTTGGLKKEKASDKKKRAVALQNAEVKAREMLDRRTDDVENFDDMGIDALLVDEAHEYKHLGFATVMQRGVKGVDPSYSKKSQGVYLKTKAVLEKNHGKNVIFATGTPISNTAAEIWTFMRYLMPADTMKEYGIYYFDDFVRNFGNIQQMLEFTTSGKFRENNRFAGYVNLPELVRIWSGVADTVLTREAGGVSDKIPEMEKGKAQDLYLPQTRALRSIMKYVKAELERFEKMSGKEKKENSHIPLTMYGIAKAAAVDARLVQADAEDDPNSKTNEAVRQTLRSLKETASYKGTVAVFADNYQNKQSGFNLYEDIRDKLISNGVPSEQIVVMKSGMTVKKKLDIFDKVNRGEVRVILGSTFTLGTGVNIQERLHTLIHLDAPNRPMDYTQRNGRILRQGNLHKKWGKPVRILRFGVEDSLDVTAYQRLKTKGAIADSIMNGKQMMNNSMTNRVLEEEEDVFGDTVAQLSGSEYAMLKNNAEKNVRKYESRKKQWESDQTYIHHAKPKLKGLILEAEKTKKEQSGYLEAVKKAFPDGKFEEITIGKHKFSGIDAMDDFIKEYNKGILDESKKMKEGGADGQTRQISISLGGYTFNVRTILKKEMSSGGGQLFSEVHRNMTYSCPELGLNDVPVHKSLLRNAIGDIVDNVITGSDFAEKVETAERALKHNQSELEQLESREGKPFEFEEELKQAKKQYQEYSELMKKEMAEKDAKYAKMDASLEAAINISLADEDDNTLYRTGNGIVVEDDLSTSNDPVSKLLGKSTRTEEQRRKFAHKERERMENTAVYWAEKLHLGNVEIVADTSQLTGRRRKAKGFYNKRTGKITIVISNHTSVSDVVQTMLHEAVGHHGLRELFGEHFDTFIDNVFRNADTDVRSQIVELSKKHGWDFRTATEEYLASLAENTNFENVSASWWNKIKELFLRMLHKIGFEGFGDFSSLTLSDNELRYLLWRSYENLAEPGRYRGILGEAADVAKQYELKVGNYAPVNESKEAAADEAKENREEVEAVNERFNAELDKQADGTLSSSHIYQLGHPSNPLLSTGIPDLPIQLSASRLKAKSSEYGHDFDLREIKDLVKSMQSPVAIFSYGNKDKAQNIIVEIQKEGKNFVVGLSLNPVVGGRHLEINSIRNVFPKDNAEWLNWISQGKLLYANKEKLQDLIDQQRTILADVEYLDLESAANIVRNFENPKFSGENVEESDDLYRKGDPEESITKAWDRIASSARFQLTETAFDYLNAVDKFQKLVSKYSGRAVRDFENAYDALTYLSSKNREEMNMFQSFYVEPINRAIVDLVGKQRGLKWDKGPLRELVMYVEAKHGAERNRQMAVEELARADKDNADTIMETWNDAKKRINGQDIPWIDKQRMLDKEAKRIGADLSKDYSGLSSVFGDANQYPEGWQEAALNCVTQYEGNHAPDKIEHLWNTLNNATSFALRKQYETGLVSREYVERQKERFSNYIPLRGFHDEIAGDVYNYIGEEYYPGGNPVKTAKGRKSEAGNPFGSILNTAYASISSGNKNVAKQAFYNLVANHDMKELAIINSAWKVRYADVANNPELSKVAVLPRIENDEEIPEWIEAVPRIPNNGSPQEISDTLSEFENVMRKYEKEGVTERIRRKSKTTFRTLHKERNEHEVTVYVGGDKYVITITANPRVSQAVNGLLNPDSGDSKFDEFVSKIGRFMAGAFTGKNAAFSIANLTKDTMYANNQVFIRENPLYWLKFTKNQKFGFGEYPLVMRRLFDYQKGKLDMDDKTERLFYEFMANGGATGYTFVNTQEEYARELEKGLNKLSKGTPSWVTPAGTTKLFFDCVEFMGQSAELVNRFAAYKTSREMGRSVSRSIRDAKEITVNFNRKGAGKKTIGENTKWYINAAATISQLGRKYILFWNANMQAKYRFFKNLQEHPVKTSATLIGNCMALSSIAIPILNNVLLPALYSAFGDGDDDGREDYFNALTDYERTHNICIRLPKGYWLKIPLSPEMAVWYSIGDAIGASLTGQRDLTASDIVMNLLNAVSPININQEYDGWKFLLNFVPTVGQPIIQNMMNTNFMGNPIRKEPFTAKQGMNPEYTNVYRSASPTLVELSRLGNRLTGGEDDKTSGWADWNPSYIQNLITGYSGGYGQTFLSISDWILGTARGEKQAVTFSKIPFVSRFLISGDKDVKLQRINTRFRRVDDFVTEFEFDMNRYENRIEEGQKENDSMKVAEGIYEYNQLLNSDRAAKYIELKEVSDSVDAYKEYLEEFPDDEVTKNLLYQIKIRGIETLHEEN